MFTLCPPVEASIAIFLLAVGLSREVALAGFIWLVYPVLAIFTLAVDRFCGLYSLIAIIFSGFDKLIKVFYFESV